MRFLKQINELFRQRTKCLTACNIRAVSSEQKRVTNELFAVQYCMNLVEKNDYENYLCTLLINGDLRRNAFALRAFNVEVARSGSNVTEPQIRKMKLKFWHDSIDKCFDIDQKSYIEDQPVLCELKKTISEHKLTKAYLKRLVTARDRPLNQPFLTMRELEEYAEQSFSSLYYLLAELHGLRDIHIDHALSHLGKAQGITTLLRAIPYKSRSESLNIPQEILFKHGISQERVLRSTSNDKGVEDCIFEVATAAYQHLEKARSLSEKVPKSTLKIFLPAISVERYLERLRKSKFW